MKVEINHLTKVIQGNVVLDDINACFSCASGENGGRIYGIQGSMEVAKPCLCA